MKDPAKAPKAKGRPRRFDADEALEKAMLLFWTKGFDSVTIRELTETMGLSRGSLYASFGNKEEIFRKAFARYVHSHGSTGFASQYATIREAVEAMLHARADFLANPEHPGCLTVVGALVGSDESANLREEVVSVRLAGLDVWRARFARAQAEGEIPASTAAIDLARFVVTVLTGMTVQARSGATREDLHRVVDVAMSIMAFRKPDDIIT